MLSQRLQVSTKKNWTMLLCASGLACSWAPPRALAQTAASKGADQTQTQTSAKKGAESADPQSTTKEQSPTRAVPRSNPSAKQPSGPRRFDDVLAELLNEFAYDLRTNQLSGVKNVSVRRVTLSEAIPKSYEAYLESMTVERFRAHSKIRVLQCTSCRVRRSVVENNKIHITVPINNPAELDQLAQQLGIDTWMDIGLLYSDTSMTLSMNAFDSRTKELVWTKVYNSEAIYRRKMAGEPLDPNDPLGETQKEPPSTLVGSVSLGYHLVPNVKRTTGMVGVNVRASERFNENRSEIGALISPIFDPDIFLSKYKSVNGDPVATGEATKTTSDEAINPFRVGFGLFAIYNHNFSADQQNYDAIRYALTFGAGPIISTGYLSLSGLSGLMMKFGRHFMLEGNVLYSAPTTIKISDDIKYRTKGGVGGDVSFGFCF